MEDKKLEELARNVIRHFSFDMMDKGQKMRVALTFDHRVFIGRDVYPTSDEIGTLETDAWLLGEYLKEPESPIFVKSRLPAISNRK